MSLNDSDEQLIKAIYGGIKQSHEEGHKLELQKRFTKRICNSIDSLKKKINFLDWALVIATVIGAIATALIAYKTFFY